MWQYTRLLVQRYVSPWLWWYVGGAFCLLLTNWLGTQIPLELAAAIDAIGKKKASSILMTSVQWIALMGVGVMIVRTLSRVLIFTPGRQIEYAIKNDLFSHLLDLQPSFYSRWKVGDIISRSANDLGAIRAMVGFGSLQIVNVAAALTMALFQMFQLSPELTMWMVLPVAIAALLVQLGIRRFFELARQSQEQLSEISDTILSSLQGIQTIQGFRAEDAFLQRFNERNQKYLELNMELAKIRTFVLPLLGLAGAVGLWILLSVGGSMVIQKQLTVGQMAAFVTLIAYILLPLRSMGFVFSVYQRYQTSLQRIFELLTSEIERPEGDEPLELSQHGGMTLELKELNFAYPDAPEKTVLKNISTTLPAGELVGIFGRTGSGKTSFLRVLTRLYNPPEGTVFVDDTDITKVSLEALRSRMAVVPQTPFLFSESIRANIKLSSEMEQPLEAVLERAALQKDLEALPEGLETVVGERGIMLSGGQRQRVTLARALVRSFDLLILDDVLSAVDHTTEHLLIQSLLRLRDERKAQGLVPPTILIVSHRLSVMAETDRVLVLNEGELVAEGTHEALLEEDGPYRDAWLQQEVSPNTPMTQKGALDV